ncbi:MAG: PKD domain-containing protein, partial [Methylococcaceae bacterium]|nr:PKD domain-containing protein [Methylococcaceae bacterium]
MSLRSGGYFDFAYRAEIFNLGPDLPSLNLTLTGRFRPEFRVVDGDLSFGPIAHGTRATSTDTFVLQKRGKRAFSPERLRQQLHWTPIANAPPVANAGPDQTVPLGAAVTLDASGSTDADGDPLTYRWTIITLPAGSQAQLSDPAAVRPTFTADKPGVYVIHLVVNDGTTDSLPASVTITTADTAPVANAGANQTVFVGTLVQLDGSGSTDVDGDPLTFTWSLISLPAGSTAQLSDPKIFNPTFVADQPGTYVAQLVVNDGHIDSAAATVTITTKNSPPVADAGPDQSVPLGSTVILDGRNSFDVDLDTLLYAWSLLSKPTGSLADIQNPTSDQPSFDVDKPGTYVPQLIVDDGQVKSAPDTVVITTQNSRPAADAGPPQTVTVGDTVTLDGMASSDADGDPLTYDWSFTTYPGSTPPALSDATAVQPTFVPQTAGDYIVQLIVTDDKGLASAPATVVITVNLVIPMNHPPAITSVPVASGTVGAAYSYPVAASDPDNDLLSYSLSQSPANMTIDAASGLIDWPQPVAGTHDVTVVVSDGRGGNDQQSYTLTITAAQASVPDLVGLGKNAAIAAINQAQFTLGTVTDANDPNVPAGKVISQNPAANSTAAPGSAIDLVVSIGPTGGGGLPPDPVDVAPPLDPTVASNVLTATQFLYIGPNPIQTGVAPGTIEPMRVAVLRGKVLDRNNQPLPGVTITVNGHPEFGQTLSRTDGMFDLVVNGGGLLPLNYQKTGYLTAQRQVQAPWQDYATAEDTILIPEDSTVSAIDLTNTSVPIQVAQGSPVTDQDGTRQATLLIPQGTQAQVYQADGTTVPVNSLHLHLTEYTVGANGPDAMPAPLPPASAYTYAVELKAEEATVKIGGKEVLFDRPVPFYVDNFLGFPTGESVPLGYYDPDRAVWVAENNGRVINILSINGGLADLELDGSGQPASPADLTALGVSDDERRQLATLYPVGKSLWRMAISHLSTWDANWGFWPPDDAEPPKVDPARDNQRQKCPLRRPGSIIECQNQLLGERLSITGTPFTLNYHSDRETGWAQGRTLHIPLSDDKLPASAVGIYLTIDVAGRQIIQQYPAQKDLTVDFTWDGLDAYGRLSPGNHLFATEVCYQYRPVLAVVSRFGYNGAGTG